MRSKRDHMRAELRRGIVAAALGAVLFGAGAVSAADRSLFVLAPSADDGRIDPAREAIAFWNARLDADSGANRSPIPAETDH